MDEIGAMQAIDGALASLDDDARQRVLTWVNAKFGKAVNQAGYQPNPPLSPVGNDQADGKKKNQSSKSTKKSKSVLSIDKNLNLMPNNLESAIDFATKKAPKNHLEKGLVAVYYLGRMMGLDTVNLSQVYTFYKHLSWQVPANLSNALSKAGVEGWLDTSDYNDLKVAVGGENHVEHKMGASV